MSINEIKRELDAAKKVLKNMIKEDITSLRHGKYSLNEYMEDEIIDNVSDAIVDDLIKENMATPVINNNLVTETLESSKNADYTAKGSIAYAFFGDSISKIDKQESGPDDSLYKYDLYSMYSLDDFMATADMGYVANKNGYIANVFVDGYNTNLGIFQGDVCTCSAHCPCSGALILTKEMYEKFFKGKEVKINWRWWPDKEQKIKLQALSKDYAQKEYRRHSNNSRIWRLKDR